jgi:hypothetical protein
MFRNRLLSIVLFIGCSTASLHWVSASPSPSQALQSFYIARTFFSDYLPGWSMSILDVSPDGDGVRVRLMRISQANDFCPGLIVRGAERTIPHTSIREVAGTDLCAFTSRRVAAALKKAAASGDISDSAAETVVATCGAHQRSFGFPYPAEVDTTRLNQSHPEVSDLWDTYRRVYQQAFSESLSFNKPTEEQEKQMTELGAQFLPDLKSGKYQRPYAGAKCGDRPCDNYLEWFLRDYSEAPQPYDPAKVTLLEASALHLIKYAPPVMPRLAMLARIYGDARLRVHVDPQTGMVNDVDALSGNKLLSDPSITAARLWQFAPGTLSDSSVEVTLRFELQCR